MGKSESVTGAVFTVDDYLRGSVAVNVPDNTVRAILSDNDVQEGTAMSDLDTRTKSLCLADLYRWCSTLPSTTGRIEDKHGVWSHSEGSATVTNADRSRWIKLANAIYRRYGELSRIPSSGIKVNNMGMKLWK